MKYHFYTAYVNVVKNANLAEYLASFAMKIDAELIITGN